MVPRKRARKNKGLPDNLYAQEKKSGTYYSYRHPITKTQHSLGSDKALAVKRARVLNERLVPDDNRIEVILGKAENTVSVLISRFRDDRLLPRLESAKIAPSTFQLIEYRLKRFDKDLGGRFVESLDTQFVADYLDANFKNDAYVKHRNALRELYDYAITKGMTDSNPVRVTQAKTDYEKARKRLTVDQFRAIHAIAPPWMQVAMELSLVTLQGRSEIVNFKYSDVGADGWIYFVRQKTKKNEWAHIRLPATPTIDEIIRRSRSDNLASPYVVHREPARRAPSNEKEHWTQLTANDFTKRFRDLRDSTGLFDNMPKNERPTFHEIRALGAWLYEKQGYDRAEYVQKLMAHADEKMTAHYQAGHEQKYVDVRADLTLESVL